MESLDFMTFVCTVLDPSLALDKFDIGSVKIEPTEWPTASRRIPPREKSDQTGKKDRQVEQIIKKNTVDKTCEVKNKGSTSTVSCGGSTLPVEDTNTSLDGKLEASKRKLREQYDKIENEKKKRCIQIVEFQKPAAVQVQTKARKPPVVKKKQSQRNGLQLVRPAATQLHRAHHVSVC